MLTWAMVTFVLRGLRLSKEKKIGFRGDIGSLFILTVIADVIIFCIFAFVIYSIFH